MTNNWCFETCTNDLTNKAPGADNSKAPDYGSLTCSEGNGITTEGTNNPFSIAHFRIYPNIQTSGPKTGAILVKHLTGSEGKYPREFIQENSFVLNRLLLQLVAFSNIILSRY